MLRPNTELLTERVMQGQPRFVDISKGVLTGENKRSKAVNKAAKFKNIKIALDPNDPIPNYIDDNLIPDFIQGGVGQPIENDPLMPDVLEGYFPQA